MTNKELDALVVRLRHEQDDPPYCREAADALAALRAERDELRAAIFGSGDYCKTLRNSNFVEMAQATEAGRKGAVARAEAAEARVAELEKANTAWQTNCRQAFEAMCAMRNNINEHIQMPSLESDLLQGPEPSVFCATVAEAVITHVSAAEARALAAETTAIERAAQVAERAEIYQNHVTVSRIRALITPEGRTALDAALADARRDGATQVVKSVWGACECLEDEASAKLEADGRTEHELGFWRGQKYAAKRIRRSTELPARVEGETK